MNLNITFYNESYKSWEYTYYIIGLILILFAIIYVFLSYSELIAEFGQEHGKFAAQISYIIALFIKGTGLMVCGYFLTKKFQTTVIPNNITIWGKYSVLPGGLPGYVTAAAYCFIFFSWCSVCLTFLDHNAVGFYRTSKTILLILLSVIILGFMISFYFMFNSSNPVNLDKAHFIEAIIASIRDVFIAIAFGIYLRKIFQLFETTCPSCTSIDGRLFWLCVMLIIALICRPFCILTYHLIFASKTAFETSKKSEFSTGYLLVFLIEQTITEIIPLGLIGYLRLVDLSRSNSIADEKNSAFLGFD